MKICSCFICTDTIRRRKVRASSTVVTDQMQGSIRHSACFKQCTLSSSWSTFTSVRMNYASPIKFAPRTQRLCPSCSNGWRAAKAACLPTKADRTKNSTKKSQEVSLLSRTCDIFDMTNCIQSSSLFCFSWKAFAASNVFCAFCAAFLARWVV